MPETDLEYVKVASEEGYGDHGAFGIEIRATIDHDACQAERSAFLEAVRVVKFAILSEKMRLDPEVQAARETERGKLLSLFPVQFSVDELQNGYCHDWCCTQKPWYRVLTPRGYIKIGWRKSVINIDWTETNVKLSGEELFPGASFTVSGKYERDRLYCHAWGYDKASEQLATILNCPKGESDAR